MESGAEPLAGRARWAVVALIVVIATDILAIVSDWLEIRLMNRLIAGEDVSAESLDSNDTRQLVVASIAFVAFVITIVLFLRWFHRAHANLPALGATPRFKPWWAIVGWFVPILWLWRPKQIANDIWRGSDSRARSALVTEGDVPALLGLWWAAWIVEGFVYGRSTLAYLAAPTAFDAGLATLLGSTEEAADLRRSAIYDLVASSIDILAAVLAILVIRRLTTRQQEREQMLAELPETTSSPMPAVE